MLDLEGLLIILKGFAERNPLLIPHTDWLFSKDKKASKQGVPASIALAVLVSLASGYNSQVILRSAHFLSKKFGQHWYRMILSSILLLCKIFVFASDRKNCGGNNDSS